MITVLKRINKIYKLGFGISLRSSNFDERFKRQRLSTSEKHYIFDLIANRKASLRSIASDFQLSQRQLEELLRKRWHNICINKL